MQVCKFAGRKWQILLTARFSLLLATCHLPLLPFVPSCRRGFCLAIRGYMYSYAIFAKPQAGRGE